MKTFTPSSSQYTPILQCPPANSAFTSTYTCWHTYHKEEEQDIVRDIRCGPPSGCGQSIGDYVIKCPSLNTIMEDESDSTITLLITWIPICTVCILVCYAAYSAFVFIDTIDSKLPVAGSSIELRSLRTIL